MVEGAIETDGEDCQRHTKTDTLLEVACVVMMRILLMKLSNIRVAEVAREHGWHPPKSLDSDKNFKPEHTLFCCELRFVAIYALFLEIFGHKKCLFG